MINGNLARRVGVLLLLGSLAWAQAPAADDAAKAKQLYQTGVKQYNLGSLKEALAAFKEAYLLRPDPVFLFNIGQCHRMMGSPSEAAYAYRRYLGEKPDAPNKADVERFIALAEEEIKRKSTTAPPTGVIVPKEGATPVEPPTTATTATTAPPVEAHPTPAAAVVVTSPPDDTRRAPVPVYRRWYVWTAFVAIVAVGAAVAIGVAVAPRGGFMTPASDLGPMTLTFQ